MKRALLTFLVSIPLIAASGKTNAAEAISNLGDVFDDFPIIGDIHGVFPGTTFATTFRTGAGSFTLDAVTLEHRVGGDPLALQSFHVQIYKEERLGPLRHNISLIGELGHPVADPAPTQWPPGQCDCGFSTEYVRYTPLAPITLDPTSHYWVAASEPIENTEEAALLFSLHFDITGFCDWSLDRSFVGYAGLVDEETGEQFWERSNPMKFKVEATPVNGVLPTCNHPPDVSVAHASVSTLWPANHQMVTIHIEGVTDPDGDPVTIRIVSIEQDELVTTPGLDTTTPDGSGLQSDTAQLRAERLNAGNGRVYKISFEATDGKPSGSSFGVVFVGAPHDQGAHATAINDGPTNGYYNSSGL